MDLPYSVIRGEILAIQIVVFNYMNKDVVSDVLLENTGQFEFAEISNEVHDAPSKFSIPIFLYLIILSIPYCILQIYFLYTELELYRKKKVEIKANSGASVSFMIIPRELGYITIKATANSILAGDSVEHKLLVKVILFSIMSAAYTYIHIYLYVCIFV